MRSFESMTVQEMVALTLTALAILVFLYLAIQFIRAVKGHKRRASEPPTSNADWHAGFHGRALSRSTEDCGGMGDSGFGGGACGDGGGGD